MKIDDIFLCRCHIGIKVKDKNGKIILRKLPKTELCFSANGIYYGIVDFKKYSVVSEFNELEEECVVMATRLNELELPASSQKNFRQIKEALFHRIQSERKTVRSIEEYTQMLSHIELVWCKKGKVTEKNGKKEIVDLPEKSCVAVLYSGLFYDLNDGKEIKRLDYEADCGEIVAYSFVSIVPDDFGEEYKNYMLAAAMVVSSLESEDDLPKVLYLR